MELIRLGVNKRIEEVKVSKDEESGVSFIFDDSTDLKLSAYHSQDCCENVFADFSIFNFYKDQIINTYVNNLIIKGVENVGFIVCFGDYPLSKVLVTCHNSQNGYYSNQLDLEIKYQGQKFSVDLQEQGLVDNNED